MVRVLNYTSKFIRNTYKHVETTSITFYNPLFSYFVLFLGFKKRLIIRATKIICWIAYFITFLHCGICILA